MRRRKGQPRRFGQRGRRSEGAQKLENQRSFVSKPNPNANQPQRWAAVYCGRVCVGHIIGRGKRGDAAYDQHDCLNGIFASAPLAANALVGKAESVQ